MNKKGKPAHGRNRGRVEVKMAGKYLILFPIIAQHRPTVKEYGGERI